MIDDEPSGSQLTGSVEFWDWLPGMGQAQKGSIPMQAKDENHSSGLLKSPSAINYYFHSPQ